MNKYSAETIQILTSALGEGPAEPFIKNIKNLEDRAWKLQCLENGGVDNWEWYGDSLKEYYSEDDD
jgi:hypothetical protein